MEQGEEQYGPVGTSVVFENEQVRIWEVLLEPGEKQELHQHKLPYVIVAIEPGNNRVTNIEGEVRDTHETPGYVVYQDSGQIFLWRPLPGRPAHQTPVQSLYHAGASTHPGPGLGGGSGMLVAGELLREPPVRRLLRRTPLADRALKP